MEIEITDPLSGKPQVPSILDNRSHTSAADLQKTNNSAYKVLTLISNVLLFLSSERSEVDAAYVLEFDGILKEARSVEIHLKQKRESLRNRLTKIANTLQR
uniref:Testis expressed 12 n=1 Tax=Xenopus tropicalis TaxID=8364 RepID=A0A6I8R1N3_XENTR